MLGASLLSPRQVRRWALALLICMLGLMVAVLVSGPEINGARRWLRIAGHSFQPSEVAKPAFVVIAAWLFAESGRRSDVPALALAVAVYVVLVTLVVLQPDIGQALLITAVWGGLFFLSGQPLHRLALFSLLATAAFAGLYAAFPHVRTRIARFLDPSSGDTYQTDRAIQSFTEGGFFGRGPGEGTIKGILPDAHTDFPFAVIGEEYGTLACLALVGLFAFVVFRALWHVWRGAGRFPAPGRHRPGACCSRCRPLSTWPSTSGLAPAKGMTLPFISSGGSSNLAAALLAGMLLSLTRRWPHAGRVKKPSFRTTTAAMDLGEPETR